MFLKKNGILGINARNLLYLKPYNQKKAVLLADDKLKTKAFLKVRDIPVPKLYGVIQSFEDLQKFDFEKLPNTFVLKPNLGYGGEGIIPIVQKNGGTWLTIDGKKMTKPKLSNHIRDILYGRYAINDQQDTAFFEQLIVAHESVGRFSYRGLPDLRIVVHNLIPVMAMLRLPTKESRGKANLHQGAIGVGIDLAKGEATHVLYRNRIIQEIPGYGSIKGHKIPFWDDILMIAVKAQLVSNLGYMAADIAIDRHFGPILLEINARAGLSVQIANLAPLRQRLQRIEGLKVTSPEKGIRIAKDMFGTSPQKSVQNLTGKTIVHMRENVDLISKHGTQKVTAFLDTSRERSVLDEDFASTHGLFANDDDYNDEKSTLKLKLSLGGKRIQTVVDLEKISSRDYKMVIGRRDLAKDFLIDPVQVELPKEHKNIHPLSAHFDPHETDHRLFDLEHKIKLLYFLRPLNLAEERKKFFENFSSNPQFVYPQIPFSIDEVKLKLLHLYFDDSPLGILFQQKAREIEKKLELLQYRGKPAFTYYSMELYGEPSAELIQEVETVLRKKSVFDDEPQNINAEEARRLFTEALKRYGLDHWQVKLKEDMVANCVAGKNNTFLVRKNAFFSERRLRNLIIHEIETHILTAENGKIQPFDIFNRGFSGYLTTQEGLALYNVSRFGQETEEDRRYAAALVKATTLAFEHSFTEVFLQMLDAGFSQEKAFRITLKVKRGLENTAQKGAFTKDFIYLEGKKNIERFVQNGGDLRQLYRGKFNLRDLAVIQGIPEIKEPRYLPHFLQK